mmetsp:Transcript_43807/g.86427  ORF Transcript_43807/g.86427 Transcript_43807/m.86427 type:complete len:102 (-) Transcript_43807:1519-1824(-)
MRLPAPAPSPSHQELSVRSLGMCLPLPPSPCHSLSLSLSLSLTGRVGSSGIHLIFRQSLNSSIIHSLVHTHITCCLCLIHAFIPFHLEKVIVILLNVFVLH